MTATDRPVVLVESWNDWNRIAKRDGATRLPSGEIRIDSTTFVPPPSRPHPGYFNRT